MAEQKPLMTTQCVCCEQNFPNLSVLMVHMAGVHTEQEIIAALAKHQSSQKETITGNSKTQQ